MTWEWFLLLRCLVFFTTFSANDDINVIKQCYLASSAAVYRFVVDRSLLSAPINTAKLSGGSSFALFASAKQKLFVSVSGTKRRVT